MKKETPVLELTALILVISIVIWGFLQWKNQDAIHCRAILSGLISGKPEVAKFIDWDKLKAMSVNIGEHYLAIPTEKEKALYRQENIKAFSEAWGRLEGKLSEFKHWRVYSRDGANVVIAADYPKYNKAVLFTLTGAKRKLVSIQWK